MQGAQRVWLLVFYRKWVGEEGKRLILRGGDGMQTGFIISGLALSVSARPHCRMGAGGKDCLSCRASSLGRAA